MSPGLKPKIDGRKRREAIGAPGRELTEVGSFCNAELNSALLAAPGSHRLDPIIAPAKRFENGSNT